ncbi:MAG: tail fiber protein [Ilumatobacteraceae bacterium]
MAYDKSRVSQANSDHTAVHDEAAARISALERSLATGLPPANAAAINQIETDWKKVQADWAAVQGIINTLVGPTGAPGATGPMGPAGRSVVVTNGVSKPPTPNMGDVHLNPPDANGHVDVVVYDGKQWVSVDGKDGKDGRDGVDGAKGDKGDKGDQGVQGNPFDYQGQTPLGSGQPTVPATQANVGHAWHETGTRNLWISTWDYNTSTASWVRWIDALPAGIKGDVGQPGRSAYQIWLDLGHGGSESDFINALKVKGDRGDAGDPGVQGPPGETLKVQGIVASKTTLPNGPAPLTVIVTQDSKHLWVFDPSSPLASPGTATGEAPSGWVDLGEISGPPGPPGPRGQGVVQTTADLPVLPRAGLSYFVLDTAEVYQWDQTSGWHSIGQPGLAELRQLLELELSRFATGISHGEPVQTIGELSPPVGAKPNEFFIVGSLPTGRWAGHAGELAWKTGNVLANGQDEWLFAAPDRGDTHMVEKDWTGSPNNYANCLMSWTGTGWVKVGSMSAAALGAGSTVGMIAYFAKGALPRGWIECNGATFDGDVYPQLKAHLGGTTLPDLRGRFFRAKDSSQTVGTRVDDTTRYPRNAIVAFASPAGTHHHNVRLPRHPSDSGHDVNPYNPGGTNYDHPFDTEDAGDHWHAIEFRSGWDSETAPKHTILIAAICAVDAGREGIQGPPGLQGLTGAKGDTGARGPAGETFKINGIVATPTDLVPAPAALSTFVVQSNGHLYVYDASSNAAVTAADVAAPGYAGAPVGYVDLGKVEGPQGPQGVAGTVTITGVTALGPGATPTVTNNGTAQDARLEIGIPAGPPGQTGPSGPAGPQGPAATVRIGRVTDAAPGAPTQVTNTGSDSNVVLDFVLQPGTPGPAGAPGPQGNPGIDGNTLTMVVAKGGTPATTPPAGTTFTKGMLAVVLK